jgi:hypothetical protein
LSLKVHDSLYKHHDFWVETGASSFAQSVISTGYWPSFDKLPTKYEEKNNKSFYVNSEFAIEAINRLVKNKVAIKVDKHGITCINPLSVAKHKRTGKICLCIDLSRHVNKFSNPKKFKIES